MVATAKTEAAEIKRLGGIPQKNSGRGTHQKGDAILEPFLVDVKEAIKSFTLNTKVWGKVCTDAIKSGRRQPALMVALGEEHPVRLWIIGDRMFKEMHAAWKEKYEVGD